MAEPAPAIRVLVADDHALFREGIRRLLAATPDMEVVGEAKSGEEAAALVEDLAPDVVLLDIKMPGMSGIDVARVIRTTSPRTRVVMLTVHANEEFLFEAIKAGAMGYLLKDASSNELLQAVRLVAQGEGLLAPGLAAKVFKEFARVAASQDLAPVLTPLTDREAEILQHVTSGLANKEIARTLNISERTVKNHLTNIMEKLHVNSRTQAAVYALRTGLVRRS
jgi:two-component system NarL family response regulator